MERIMEHLFEALNDLINEPGPWRDKKAKVLDRASQSEEDTNALQEFVSWFNEEPDEVGEE